MDTSYGVEVAENDISTVENHRSRHVFEVVPRETRHLLRDKRAPQTREVRIDEIVAAIYEAEANGSIRIERSGERMRCIIHRGAVAVDVVEEDMNGRSVNAEQV